MSDWERRLKATEDAIGKWRKSGFDLLQAGRLWLRSLPSDPVSLPNGLIWLRADRLRTRLSATSYSLPMLLSSTGAVTVQNTVTETNLVSVSVPADAMGATGKIKYEAIGQYLQNGAANDTFRLRVKFGGSTRISEITGNIAQSATAHPVRLVVEVGNYAAANQWVSLHLELGQDAAATTGIGDFAANNDITATLANTGAVDTTTAQTFAVTVELGTNNASIVFQVLHGAVFLI